MTVIFIFSHLSGALVNPAIVISLVITRNMGFVQGIYYVVVQSKLFNSSFPFIPQLLGRSREPQSSTVSQDGIGWVILEQPSWGQG